MKTIKNSCGWLLRLSPIGFICVLNVIYWFFAFHAKPKKIVGLLLKIAKRPSIFLVCSQVNNNSCKTERNSLFIRITLIARRPGYCPSTCKITNTYVVGRRAISRSTGYLLVSNRLRHSLQTQEAYCYFLVTWCETKKHCSENVSGSED